MFDNLPVDRVTVPDRPTGDWPLNEIILQFLVHSGLRSDQIAGRYGVTVDQVNALRTEYEL